MKSIKMTSVEVKAETRKVRVNVTREMANDLQSFRNFDLGYSAYLSYKLEDKSEKLIIEKYIKPSEYSDDSEIIYEMDNILLRIIKLLKLSNNPDSIILEKVIEKSTKVTVEDLMIKNISKDLAKQIDLEILSNLYKLK